MLRSLHLIEVESIIAKKNIRVKSIVVIQCWRTRKKFDGMLKLIHKLSESLAF